MFPDSFIRLKGKELNCILRHMYTTLTPPLKKRLFNSLKSPTLPAPCRPYSLQLLTFIYFFFFFHNTTVDSSDICMDCPTLNILTKKVGGGWTCSDFQTPLLFYGNWEFHVTGVGEPPPYYNRPNLWSTKHLLSNALNYHIQIHLHNIFLYP